MGSCWEASKADHRIDSIVPRTFRKHRIYAGTHDGGETAREICRIMRLKDGQSFTAYDEVALDSPLHLICGVPVGPVTLLPNGVRGVQAILSK